MYSNNLSAISWGVFVWIGKPCGNLVRYSVIRRKALKPSSVSGKPKIKSAPKRSKILMGLITYAGWSMVGST